MKKITGAHQISDWVENAIRQQFKIKGDRDIAVIAVGLQEAANRLLNGIDRYPGMYGPRMTPTPILEDWRPSEDAMQLMTGLGKTPVDFIEAQLPVFVDYWLEAGDIRTSWNLTFVQWIRREWMKHQEHIARTSTPNPTHTKCRTNRH